MDMDYGVMLLAKEEVIRNSMYQIMNRAKKSDDIEHMSEDEFTEKKDMYRFANLLIDENMLLCKVIAQISVKQDAIWEKLKNLENKG